MRKKLTLKGRIMIRLILTCLFSVLSCRKDLLTPNSNDLKNGLSIAEAKSFFEANLNKKTESGELMSTESPGTAAEDSEIKKS